MSEQEIDRILSAVCALDALANRRMRIAELRQEISKIRTTCGSCQFWMCSGDCPAEWNDNGRNRGPSMNSRACDKFRIKPYDAERERCLLDEIEQLQTPDATQEGVAP